MKTDVVRVLAPARLHLGFLDMNGSLGRRFGGIGLGISAPQTRLTLRHAAGAEHRISGPESERAGRHLAAMAQHLNVPGAVRMSVDSAIPPHAGLGSGTQLALAVAAGLRHLHGLPLDPEGDAARLGRGLRSGLGAGLFRRGGLMVDGGKGDGSTTPPPIVSSLVFPKDWRVILVLDRLDHGLHGAAELDAFHALPPFPDADAAQICRLTLMQLLPGAAEGDFAAFCHAQRWIQRLVGAHFAPAQGGIFTSRRVGDAIRRLEALGAGGSGQSSWGPTGFAFAADPDAALHMCRRLEEEGLPDGLEVRCVAARSSGASVETVQDMAQA
ncbi:beta-ribofuranosylaminobenzene 5'-phosphate synthase family protein [Aureimonas frigidaquae]|uniref:beta-ribofuranosylaminobenzene 5'-phosphate synthase family protein n=1 Tax=Aureimonas frigidaquae TaxID=424757 RepID=UPI000B25D23C|nr:beta-ribofuranosylaminobenzene 5'-phosphate synthase family protein [Aureimonas frigidaquae]